MSTASQISCKFLFFNSVSRWFLLKHFRNIIGCFKYEGVVIECLVLTLYEQDFCLI